MTFRDDFTKEMLYNKITESFCYKDSNKIFESLYLNKPDELFEKIYNTILNSCEGLDEILPVNFPDDVDKIKKDFNEYGFIINDYEAEYLWEDRSDRWMASWLDLSGSNTFMEYFELIVLDQY